MNDSIDDTSSGIPLNSQINPHIDFSETNMDPEPHLDFDLHLPSSSSSSSSAPSSNVFPTWPDYKKDTSSSLFSLENMKSYLTTQNIFLFLALVVVLFFALGSIFKKKEETLFPETLLSGESPTPSYNLLGTLGIVFVVALLVLGLLQFFGYDMISLMEKNFGLVLGNRITSSPSSQPGSPLTQFLTGGGKVAGSSITSGPNAVTVPPSENEYTDLAKQNSPDSSTIQEITTKEQVFNIPGNYYNYDNAKAVCSAYGARLATYSEIEDAYKNGGEWCNYGWSDGQMALFPTQDKTFNKYQKIKGHEHDCGRPGVNGGYMENPDLQFGVNCYGYKPRINEKETYLMQYQTPYPKSKEELESEKKVSYWKNKINDILVSPFNYDVWSQV